MTFDLLRSYPQVELDDKSWHFTMFIYPHRDQIEWTVAPMGLKFNIFVGMKLSDNRYSQDPDKMQPIKVYIRPESCKSVEHYLGTCKQFQF